MNNEIEWDKVPKDRIEEARLLDERLKIYETGYYHNYGNAIAGINMRSDLLLRGYGQFEKISPKLKTMFCYLDAIYEDQNIEEIPLTEDTQHYFNCRELYPAFRNAFGTLEEQADNGQDINGSLNELKNLSSGIITKMDQDLYGEIYWRVFEALKEIPGCENRIFHRKKPKNYKDF